MRFSAGKAKTANGGFNAGTTAVKPNSFYLLF
jgi:hypothetical protein